MTVATQPDPLILLILCAATVLILATVQWIIEGPPPDWQPEVKLDHKTVRRIVAGHAGWREAQP